jgi:3-hydroxyisobutyrate dehydrogenase
MKIAFIGLGNMGMPMALNLNKSKKIQLIGFDINNHSVQKFKKSKGKVAKTLDEAFECDIIISCLPGPKQIRQIAIGKNKLIEKLSKNKIWIDCSTNSISCFNFLQKKLEKKINQFIDAPISGGNIKAKSGELSMFIGGSQKLYKKTGFIFKILGKNLYYLGKHGAGYAAKIAQVSLCYLNYLSLSEALMLGTKSGIKPQTMLQIIDKSASGGYTSTRYGPDMINGSYDPSFTLGLSFKDLKLAKEIINLKNIKLPITNLTTSIYSKAIKKYGANSNHLKAIKLLEARNKLILHKGG